MPIELDDRDLGQITVFVERRSVRTETGGTFFLGHLAPGLYRVTLDVENLPIELVPERVSFVVEVAAAAVTRVDFTVRPEFGLAGRIRTAAGADAPGVEVEVLDGEGRRLRSVRADRFGLFRVDGLPIGFYTLRIASASLPGLPEEDLPVRSVEIRDDFLFDQDLTLPVINR